jgi:hypothetical protein
VASFYIDNFKIEYHWEPEELNVNYPESFFVEEIYHAGEPIYQFLVNKLGLNQEKVDEICLEIIRRKNDD